VQPRALDVGALQAELRRQGVYLQGAQPLPAAAEGDRACA
jgi:hypothetical protein